MIKFLKRAALDGWAGARSGKREENGESQLSAPCPPSPEGCWAFQGPQVNVFQNLQEDSFPIFLGWLLVQVLGLLWQSATDWVA